MSDFLKPLLALHFVGVPSAPLRPPFGLGSAVLAAGAIGTPWRLRAGGVEAA